MILKKRSVFNHHFKPQRWILNVKWRFCAFRFSDASWGGGLRVKECRLSRTRLSLCTSGWLRCRVWFHILHPLALFRLPILLEQILAGMCSAWAHAGVQKYSLKWWRCGSAVPEWKSRWTNTGVGSTELIKSFPQKSPKAAAGNQLRPVMVHKLTHYLTNSCARLVCVVIHKRRNDAFWALCSFAKRGVEVRRFPGTHLVLWWGVTVLLDRREVLVSCLPAWSAFLLDASGTWTHPSNPSFPPTVSLLCYFPSSSSCCCSSFPRLYGCSATSLISKREKEKESRRKTDVHVALWLGKKNSPIADTVFFCLTLKYSPFFKIKTISNPFFWTVSGETPFDSLLCVQMCVWFGTSPVSSMVWGFNYAKGKTFQFFYSFIFPQFIFFGIWQIQTHTHTYMKIINK